MQKSIFAILIICLSAIRAEDNERILQNTLNKNIEAALKEQESTFRNLEIDVKPEFVEEFSKALNEVNEQSGITAVVNEYADKLLINIAKLINQTGLDPTGLPDLPISLLGGGLNLTVGSLNGISTIHRTGDVIASYSVIDKKLKLDMSIGFNDLAIHYKYKVWIFFVLSIHGGMEGKLNNVVANIKLDFDFNTYQASLNRFDITNSGLLSLHFEGHGLVDWLINLMSDATSLVLHPLIIRIISGPIINVVAKINEIIYSFLHPTTSLEFILN